MRIKPTSATRTGTSLLPTPCPPLLSFSRAATNCTSVRTHLPAVYPQFLRNAQLVQASGPPPPADFKGFVEQDNVVAIDAADTSPRAGGALNSTEPHWVELPAYGEGKSAMTVFPVDSPSDTNSPAGLSYSVYLYDTKDLTLHLRLAPTLNFVPGPRASRCHLRRRWTTKSHRHTGAQHRPRLGYCCQRRLQKGRGPTSDLAARSAHAAHLGGGPCRRSRARCHRARPTQPPAIWGPLRVPTALSLYQHSANVKVVTFARTPLPGA